MDRIRPIDAINEAIPRINVVLRLLNTHDYPLNPSQDEPAAEEGYDLCIATEALERVRDLLQAALAKGDDDAATT